MEARENKIIAVRMKDAVSLLSPWNPRRRG